MPERSGGVYARMDARPYTRKSDRKPRKSYAKGVPGSKIHMFEMGNPKGNFEIEVSLIANKSAQLKHNSLEAARVSANKALSVLGNAYFFKVRVFPHHILRENPLATGAGADRFQEGMSRAYGKPIGMAARVKEDQKIISIRINKDKIEVAKEAMRRARMKLSVGCSVIVEKLEKKTEVKVEEKPEKEKETSEKVEEKPPEPKEKPVETKAEEKKEEPKSEAPKEEPEAQ